MDEPEKARHWMDTRWWFRAGYSPCQAYQQVWILPYRSSRYRMNERQAFAYKRVVMHSKTGNTNITGQKRHDFL